MKLASKLVIAAIGFAMLASCSSIWRQYDEEPELRSPWTIVDHQNLGIGGEIPDWLSQDVGALEAQSTFAGKYVFKLENFGQSLQGTKNQATINFINTEVARMIETRVEQKYVEAQVGDQDFVESYFENLVQVLTAVDLSGLTKYGEYWLLRVHNETEEEQYAYYALYTMQKEILDEQIAAALDEAPAQTEEEQTARERVREILSSGL